MLTSSQQTAKAALKWFVAIALIGCWLWLLTGCASQPPITHGPVIRQGVSNGAENDGKLGILLGYAFEGLRVSLTPVRLDRLAHPIIGGDSTGWITMGSANRLPDPVRLTPANYSGFVLAEPGLDWRFIR